MPEYKVITQKDGYFRGKFNPREASVGHQRLRPGGLALGLDGVCRIPRIRQGTSRACGRHGTGLEFRCAHRPGLEWIEAEQVSLELLRKQADTRRHPGSPDGRRGHLGQCQTPAVAELAADLRLSRQAVAKYVAALPTDETPVKSARHQRAAQALWGVRGVAS